MEITKEEIYTELEKLKELLITCEKHTEKEKNKLLNKINKMQNKMGYNKNKINKNVKR